MAKESRQNIYIVPDNFIEGGRILNGMFKTRNFIEAIILSLAIGIPLWIIPYSSITTKITVMISVIGPFFLIGIAGINGDSLIQFLQLLKKWRKNKRVMLYNNKVRIREVRPGDVMIAKEVAKDKFVKGFEDWKEKRKEKNRNVSYVEGIDFTFIEDDEFNSSFISTEKKLLGVEDKPKENKKDKKKKKKGNAVKLLSESTISEPDEQEPESDIVLGDDVLVLDSDDAFLCETGFVIEDI